MILKKIYNEKEHIQEIWYDSTMIYYTKMVEDEFDQKGNSEQSETMLGKVFGYFFNE